MATKIDELKRCNFDFLLSIAKGVNLSYRHYDSSDEEHIFSLLSNKYKVETINKIIDMYMLCCNSEEVINAIKKDGMDSIARKIPAYFGVGEYYYEVPLGNKICDIVLNKNNEILALEIKSAGDKILKAIDQTEYYKNWSDKTYLVYDISHKKQVEKLFKNNNDIGLLEYSQDGIYKIKEASKNKIEKHSLLNCMTYKYLKSLAKYFNVKSRGNKKDIINRICEKGKYNTIHQLFQDYLRSKYHSR